MAVDLEGQCITLIYKCIYLDGRCEMTIEDEDIVSL